MRTIEDRNLIGFELQQAMINEKEVKVITTSNQALEGQVTGYTRGYLNNKSVMTEAAFSMLYNGGLWHCTVDEIDTLEIKE